MDLPNLGEEETDTQVFLMTQAGDGDGGTQMLN